MHNRQGSVLITAYLFVAFSVVWAATGLQRSSIELRSAERYVETLQAFHTSEGGLDDASRWMRNQPGPPSGTLPFDPFAGPQGLARGRFRVSVDPDDGNPTSYRDVFVVRATGEVNGIQVTRSILQVLRSESFSRYSYFTESERLANGTLIWFSSNDHLQGPVHTNDQLNIVGNPVFDGPVTSAAGAVIYRNPPPTGGNNPQFNGGLTLNANPIQLPANLTKLRLAASSAQGAWFIGNTTITLQSNGTMLVTNAQRGWVNQPQPLPANGAIFVNGGNASVSGTLDGQLTIGSNQDVVITSDVVYADPPTANPASNDVLGLVAERNVVVSQTAPNDLDVHASIMALNTSFTVANWWTGAPRGTLSVYGGIIQKRRGPVGSIDPNGTLVTGYGKDYRYDARLADTAPPFFPTIADYEYLLWQEEG